ncbi:MAG TPA: hypothetical protein VHV51_03920, partial [Polyangiaceae bacterium]|nr:hypothetical protein [Polyangiaceae bacterium]
DIHMTGTVDNYGFGFGLYFSSCSDLSAYTGVSFKIKGNAGTTMKIDFQVQTNEDYPWQALPSSMKGGCTATPANVANPFADCIAPTDPVTVATAESTVTVMFTDIMGGKPTATVDPKQVVGIQWGFEWSATAMPYLADVTVSDITLIGGTGVSCTSGTGGTGGSGGSGGAAGGGGGSGGAAAGSGGTGG